MKTRIGKLLTLLLVALIALSTGAKALATGAGDRAVLGTRPDKGDLTIHKYYATDSSQIGNAGDGTQLATPPNIPAVKGVQFDVYKVGDPITADAPQVPPGGAGWTYSIEGGNLKVTDGTTDYEYVLGAKASADGGAQTDVNGVLKYTDLAAGHYYVEENLGASTPTIQKDGNDIGITITEAVKSFLVSVPMWNETDELWNSNVHVYPKNQGTEPTKTVNGLEDISAEVGEDVKFTITVPLPADIANYKQFDIVDELNDAFYYTTDSAKTIKVYGVAEDDSKTELSAGSNFTAAHADGTVTVSFSETGREALATAGYKSVIVEFHAALNEYIHDNEKFVETNEAKVVWQNANGDLQPAILTNAVKVNAGEVDINKVDQEGTALKGAEFQVAESEADAKAKSFLKVQVKTVGSVEYVANILSPGEAGYDTAATWIVSPHAAANSYDSTNNIYIGTTFQGLKTHGTASDGTATPNKYWLAETKSPDGYNLLEHPVAAEFTGSNYDEDKHILGLEIVNTNQFTLPQTGGLGSVILTIIGVALIGFGFLFFINEKKEKA